LGKAYTYLSMNCLLLVVLVGGCWGLNDGLGLRPSMGFNTWYSLFMHPTERDCSLTLTLLQQLGLRAVGYEYFNLDDGVFASRNATGGLVVNTTQFPSGIDALAKAVHAAGFKFGLYGDRGVKTCGGRPGSQGYEYLDAKTYAEIGVDFLKQDSCNTADDPVTGYRQYSLMRDALQATGRPIYYNLCGWHAWYAPMGAALGHSWRTGQDDGNWRGILKNIDDAEPLSRWAGPGGFNDPDYLLFQDAAGSQAQTPTQSRVQFSVYAMLAAPLIISQDLSRATPFVLETLLNKEVIAIDQDPLGHPGTRVVGGNLTSCVDQPQCINVWTRRLTNGDYAILFVNVGTQSASTVVCDGNTLMKATGWISEQRISLWDVWSHSSESETTAGAGITVVSLASDSGIAMFLMKPTF